MTSVVRCWWLSLQHDWRNGFNHSEKVWVSAHHLDHKTFHSYLTSQGPTDDKFTSKLVSDREIEVAHPESTTSTRFIAPVLSSKVTPKNNPISVDITSSGGLGAVTDGKDVLVFEGPSGNVRRTLSGHVADVECVSFFPSNKVLLTGACDMCVKIWSVEDGSCPVTLTGHTRGVTTLGMVGVGRHVVSGSLDGTIKVWVCGTQQCLSTISPQAGAINQLHVIGDQQAVSDSSALILSATERGLLSLHNTSQSSSCVFSYQHSEELTACNAVNQNTLVAGSIKGDLITLDVRNSSQPISCYKRSNYAISSIATDCNRVWCSQRDGECYTINTDTTLQCDTTLSGGDCDAVLCLVAKGGVITTTSKDRILRRYEV